MADLDISSNRGLTDVRFGRGGNQPFAETANMNDIAALKARLTAISATQYPATKLATMTKNDMVYALRVESADSAGIR